MPSSTHYKNRFLPLFAYLLILAATNASANFPLPMPSRPDSFPLTRSANGSGVVAWGANWSGQTEVPIGLTDVVQISAGWEHAMALTANGSVRVWGSDSYGQMDVPPNLQNPVQLAGGDYHSLALQSDGTVKAWGMNIFNQVDVPLDLQDVVQIDAGLYHSLALKSDGTVVAWGPEWDGSVNVPTGLQDVVQIAAGVYHSLALKSDGTIVAWGSAWEGQLNIPAGLSDVVQIAAGGYHSVALKSDGTVVAWGPEWDDQISFLSSLTGAVQVASGTYHSVVLLNDGTVLDSMGHVPQGLTQVLQIAAGESYSVAIGKTPPVISASNGAKVAWAQKKPFEDQLYASGGSLPHTWEIVSVRLPDGIALEAAGRIHGVPNKGGIFHFGVRVTDADGLSDSRELVLRIIPEVASGGGYFFKHLAGTLYGTYIGSGDASSFTGSAHGSGGFSGSADGTGGFSFTGSAADSPTAFSSPAGIAVDKDGNIFVGDSQNYAIRKIFTDGRVENFVGSFSGSSDESLGGSFTGSGTRDDWGPQAEFSSPQGLAADNSGNLFVAESGSHRIRKVSPFGQVTHYVGGIGFSGSADGSPSAARFNQPADVAVDSSGNIYVADSGNHAIRRIAANGTVSTWAGTMGAAGNTDATGNAALFRSPQGVAVDGSGNVYVADTGNSVIRKISSSRVVTTLAGAAFTGSAGESYGRASFTGSAYAAFLGSADSDFPQSVDGVGAASRFSFPTDIEVDSTGNLYVTDSGTSKIRKISTNGTVTTLGDTPDGFFYNPLDLAVSANGTIFVADTGDNRIAMTFTPAPEITIELPGGISLSNNESASSFGAFLLQNNAPRTYTIRNTGYVELGEISVTKNGTNAADFSLGSLGISSLAPGDSTTFTISFIPSSGGQRAAQLSIASNDPVNNPFLVNLAGFGISSTLDTDGDGVNDAAEYHMATLGFDFETTQTEMANAYLAGVNAGGLYTEEQLQALNIGTPLISKNPTTGNFELTVGLQKSTNLQSFQHFSLQDTDTTIEPDGRLKIRFSIPDNAAFFRLHAE